MRPSSIAPRSIRLLILSMLFILIGCGDEDSPTRPPTANVPVEPGTPVEVREDAREAGLLDPITLHAASREGTNLKVTVSYGGCEVHTIRALASTGVLASYPATIDIYLQHDRPEVDCDMLLQQELSFDVRPVFDFMEAKGMGGQPFSAKVMTPAALTDPTKIKRVLFQP